MVKRLKAAFKAFKSPDLIEKARKDFLTGALLKEAFVEASEREFQRAIRSERSLALVFIDIDNFKWVNDTRGHAEGDLHLKAFARSAFLYIRPFDILARWGGDEFLLLLSADKKTAEKIVRRIHHSFPDFSWGISVWGKNKTFQQVFGDADKDMYVNKESRKKLLGSAFGRLSDF